MPKLPPGLFDPDNPAIEIYRDYIIRKPGRQWFLAFPPGKDRASAQALELGTLRRLIDRQCGVDPGPRPKAEESTFPGLTEANPVRTSKASGKLCECGCGEQVASAKSRFKMGHNMRKKAV